MEGYCPDVVSVIGRSCSMLANAEICLGLMSSEGHFICCGSWANTDSCEFDEAFDEDWSAHADVALTGFHYLAKVYKRESPCAFASTCGFSV